jgi:energy-coupling factor transport system ATP-binding protein
MAVLELDAISFAYPGGVWALRDVSLSFEEGRSVAIVGQNGAGKTTLVKMIIGLLRPSHGVVRLRGQDISDVPTAKIAHQVGFVFQNPRTQIFLGSVLEEVVFGPKKLGMSAARVEELAEGALRLTGLEAKRAVHPYELTPPDRKLLTIASILSMDQPILILDEPTGGLDAQSVERVARVVDAYHAEGRTVITVTHNMDFVVRCFEHVVVMRQGQVATCGTVGDVFSQHDLLADTHLAPTAIGQLAAVCGLPRTILTVSDMVQYIERTVHPA